MARLQDLMNDKDMTIQKKEKDNLADLIDNSRCTREMELALIFVIVNAPKNNLLKFSNNQEKQLDRFLKTHRLTVFPNKTLCEQVDEVAMVSPLATTLINLFLAFMKNSSQTFLRTT